MCFGCNDKGTEIVITYTRNDQVHSKTICTTDPFWHNTRKEDDGVKSLKAFYTSQGMTILEIKKIERAEHSL